MKFHPVNTFQYIPIEEHWFAQRTQCRTRSNSIHSMPRSSAVQKLFNNNKQWAAAMRQRDPHFFQNLSNQQVPQWLWIGCSDSRVPANDIVGLLPGELFVHRNVANVVVPSDLNCLSVMQFAVDYLKVRNIVVCGHYGCSGVQAALFKNRLGLIDNWLRHVQDVKQIHRPLIESIVNDKAKEDLLSELNVVEQVTNVVRSTVVLDAWDRGQELEVHGWIYGIHDGHLQDLEMTIRSYKELPAVKEAAIAKIIAKRKESRLANGGQ